MSYIEQAIISNKLLYPTQNTAEKALIIYRATLCKNGICGHHVYVRLSVQRCPSQAGIIPKWLNGAETLVL